ncbi:hypothetical protein ACLOAV_010217 [Pseudogymnoascus australis]
MCLVEWMPSFWTTFVVVFTVFMGLAFYETREEYMNSLANVREINLADSVEQTDVATRANDDENSLPSTSNSETGMCPMALSRTIAHTDSSIPRKISAENAFRVYTPTNEGADPAEWTYAYLLTVPSINGQVDNPLGFWYLYTADRQLTAIVAELNASYGERRMWLVRQTLEPKLESETSRKSLYTFRGHFGKDIHVSPFMPSTGGGYTIDTSDPCASSLNQLDILVTLTKAEGGPLLVTRVTSSSPGLDASAASMWEKITFLVRWCYVPTTTVMTYRILSQAARIYLKAPRVWTRPEPTKTALGKPARAVERTLERSFRLILKNFVENHPLPLSLTYVTPGEHSNKSEAFRSLNAQEPRQKSSDLDAPPTDQGEPRTLSFGNDNGPPHIALQVISPVFYSNFFHYDSPCSAFTGELLDDHRTRTLWSSNPNLFMSIFYSTASFTGTKPIAHSSVSNHWRWRLVSILRTAPVATNCPRSTPYKSFRGLSCMDHWILERCLRSEAENYRRAMLRIFIGEWIGGTAGPLKRFSNDLEPFGLSRDAVLRIYDATIKAFVVSTTVSLIRVLETGYNTQIKGLVGWAVAGVNLWACLKAYV